MLGGEPDIIKALQLQPGIQGGKEGTSGLFVRGGTPDQNLFLLDDVPVYNVNHIGGFLSTFDANAINSIKVYKGNFPAQYSGRLSSVLDIRMKNGNQRKTSGEVQVGLLSTKLQIEGPLGKDSSWTYLASARRFNLDIFTSLIFLMGEKHENFGYTFFDSNLKLVKRFKDNSTLSFGYYGGRDKIYAYAGESIFDSPSRIKSIVKWGNYLGYIQYNKAINKKLYYDVNLASTFFFFSNTIDVKETLSDGSTDKSGIAFKSNITDFMLKQSLTYKVLPNWTVKGGWNTVSHTYLPGRMISTGVSKDTIIGGEKIHAWENNMYVENHLKFTDKFKANIGFNFSTFTSQGKTFISPEPRVLLQYFPNKIFSIQAGYTRMQQFMHLLSNNGGGIPNDIWIPATSELAQGKYEYLMHTNPFSYSMAGPTENSSHIYNGKNSVRLPAYHRLDLGINFKKEKKKGMRIWSISLYNAYNQKNAFFYFYKKNTAGVNTLHQVTVFPIIPNFSYRFVF